MAALEKTHTAPTPTSFRAVHVLTPAMNPPESVGGGESTVSDTILADGQDVVTGDRHRPDGRPGIKASLGGLPPPYPSGWYCLGLTTDVRPGQVIKRQFMGREVVLYRTRS